MHPEVQRARAAAAALALLLLPAATAFAQQASPVPGEATRSCALPVDEAGAEAILREFPSQTPILVLERTAGAEIEQTLGASKSGSARTGFTIEATLLSDFRFDRAEELAALTAPGGREGALLLLRYDPASQLLTATVNATERATTFSLAARAAFEDPLLRETGTDAVRAEHAPLRLQIQQLRTPGRREITAAISGLPAAFQTIADCSNGELLLGTVLRMNGEVELRANESDPVSARLALVDRNLRDAFGGGASRVASVPADAGLAAVGTVRARVSGDGLFSGLRLRPGPSPPADLREPNDLVSFLTGLADVQVELEIGDHMLLRVPAPAL